MANARRARIDFVEIRIVGAELQADVRFNESPDPHRFTFDLSTEADVSGAIVGLRHVLVGLIGNRLREWGEEARLRHEDGFAS